MDCLFLMIRLNTIFGIQGKQTSIADLKYFEKSFDKFSYIYKKEIADSFGVNIGYFFVLSEPKRYKSDALTLNYSGKQKNMFRSIRRLLL